MFIIFIVKYCKYYTSGLLQAYFNFGNSLCDSNEIFNYFTIIITKIIVDYGIDVFFFCKLKFLFDFPELDSKGILGGFGSILYKHISISYYSKIVFNFSILFNPLSVEFKNRIIK